jgi:hypothetical protein
MDQTKVLIASKVLVDTKVPSKVIYDTRELVENLNVPGKVVEDPKVLVEAVEGLKVL